MNLNVKKSASICALVASLALSSCASISGAVTGPAYQVSETHKKYKTSLKENDYPPVMVGIAILSYPMMQAISIGGSVPMGFFDGLAADIYFAKKGKYPDGYRPWKLGSGEEALDKLREEENNSKQ